MYIYHVYIYPNSHSTYCSFKYRWRSLASLWGWTRWFQAWNALENPLKWPTLSIYTIIMYTIYHIHPLKVTNPLKQYLRPVLATLPMYDLLIILFIILFIPGSSCKTLLPAVTRMATEASIGRSLKALPTFSLLLIGLGLQDASGTFANVYVQTYLCKPICSNIFVQIYLC